MASLAHAHWGPCRMGPTWCHLVAHAWWVVPPASLMLLHPGACSTHLSARAVVPLAAQGAGPGSTASTAAVHAIGLLHHQRDVPPRQQATCSSAIGPTANFRVGAGLAGQMSTVPDAIPGATRRRTTSTQLAVRAVNGLDWLSSGAGCREEAPLGRGPAAALCSPGRLPAIRGAHRWKKKQKTGGSS